MKNKLLPILYGIRIETKLQENICKSKEYKQSLRNIEKAYAKLDNLNINKKQKLAIDRLVSLMNISGAVYGNEAYKQGFEDGLKILSEIHKLK